ncbi:flagellar hook-basal body complex protein [Ensifer adhaerens]|uniref:flagellar hook-basal body complex protein n=2 Tax=Ensifer adhaerens TaxID=106592 RepID=UPI002E288B70|nr:flagellar hook-basal body complex protein [Ensifer adhaerens]
MQLDVYFSRTGPTTWEVTAYDPALAAAGGFPYGAAGDPPLATMTLTFDPATGNLVGGGSLSVPLPSGDTLPLDFSQSVSLPDGTPGWTDKIVGSLNLPASAPAVVPYVLGTTPADNLPSSVFNEKSSMVVYDKLGLPVQLDFFYTKGEQGRWEVTVFNHADASPTSGTFPYGLPGSPPLATTVLEFDALGNLVSNGILDVPVPGGETVRVDMSSTGQIGYEFSPGRADVNGMAPSKISGFEIASDGTVFMKYGDGSLDPAYRIALANVQSPDRLRPETGNVYSQSADSGVIVTGFPENGAFGNIRSRTLENSNVDIANELTSMIESQRNYTANSKVFQTASDLLDVLVNLKR